MKALSTVIAVSCLSFLVTGCSAIQGIFKAGIWTGVIFVVGIIALVIFIIVKISGGRNN